MAGDRIAALLRQVEAGAPGAASELVREVLALHGEGLKALMEIVGAQPELLARAAREPRLQGVLLLHGLHPRPAEERVREALAAVPGVEVQEARVEHGVLRLVLSCPQALPPGDPLPGRIEAAVFEAAPELDDLQLEGLPAARPVIPIAVAAK